MATRGRKQKACFLNLNLGEMLEIRFAGKTTKKRQNYDTFTPPVCTWHPLSTLNGETRRAPALPDTSSYPAWEKQTTR
jgi:hypothetical protein